MAMSRLTKNHIRYFLSVFDMTRTLYAFTDKQAKGFIMKLINYRLTNFNLQKRGVILVPVNHYLPS